VDPARIVLQASVFGELTHSDVEKLLPHPTERRYDAEDPVAT
jgi:hypothetical protein